MPVSACSVAVIKAKMNIFLWVMAPSLLLSSRVYVRVRASFMHVSFMHLPKYCRFVHSCMSCDLWSCVVPVKTRYHSLSISAVTVKHYQKKPDQNIGHAVWSENPSVGCSLGDPRSSVYCMYWCSTVCTWYPGLSRRTYAFFFLVH